MQGGHQAAPLPTRRVRRQGRPVGANPPLPGSGSEEQHQTRTRLPLGNQRPPAHAHGRLQTVAGNPNRLRRRHRQVLQQSGRRGQNHPLLDGPRAPEKEERTSRDGGVSAGAGNAREDCGRR
uniref:(northern house mosquito) hypothetical protein n=1 Tax=Culex pipiens TaxID=7175 RepID=A0A8D8AIJ2_CULPI